MEVEIHPNLIGGGCENHMHTDKVQFKNGTISRCLDCGSFYMTEDNRWHNIPRFVIDIIKLGKYEGFARIMIAYMHEAREKDGVPYPEYTYEEYVEIIKILEQ